MLASLRETVIQPVKRSKENIYSAPVSGIAAGVRRLHDPGKSGWWLLIGFTVIGAFVLLYWFTQPGEGENQYGPYVAARE